MKILLRIVLALVLLGLLCGLAAILSVFVAIPWLSGFVSGMVARWPWLTMAFSIVLLCCIVAGVLALILVAFVPTKQSLFILGRDAGKIEISRQSIESVAGGCLEGIKEVKRFHVETKGDMRPKKLKLEIQVEPRSGQINLSELGHTVQQRLAQDLGDSLDMNPKYIKVRMQPVHQSLGERHGHSKVPRVV